MTYFITRRIESGYTLTEIMIVVLIVGILAAFATLSYRDYVLRSKLTIIYSELNGFKMPYQALMVQGSGVSDFTPSGLNMYEDTEYCHFTVTEPNLQGTTNDAVRCNIHNIPVLEGKAIMLDKTVDGVWVCHTNIVGFTKQIPLECQ